MAEGATKLKMSNEDKSSQKTVVLTDRRTENKMSQTDSDESDV